MRHWFTTFLLSAVSLTLSHGADTAYPATVAPFLETYCLDCHDAETQKGNLSLEELDPDVINGKHMETWRMIRDQLHFREMPPEKKKQPTEEKRAAVLKWVRNELLKPPAPGSRAEAKLALPEFGNYVDHHALFDERRPFVTPAPPRIWRLRPSIYETVTPRLGEGISGLANGLSYADGPVIKDYAGRYFVDEASTAPLLGNAKKVAAAMTGSRSKDKRLKALTDPSNPPNAEKVREAIGSAFYQILGRQPLPEETARFLAFYNHGGGSPGDSRSDAAGIFVSHRTGRA